MEQAIPTGWLAKSLEDVCNFIGGSQPPKSTFVYDLSTVNHDEYTRLIQIRDYKSDQHVVYIPKNRTKKFCKEHEVMIGRYGPPVFQILKGLEGAYNVALMKAEPRTEKLSRNFLFLFLQNPSIQSYIINLSVRASGQTGVNKKALHAYPILIPPLLEQRRIVAILDEAFEGIDQAIANTERNLANARELFDSYLNEVFTRNGEERYLGDVCDFLNGFAFKSADTVDKSKTQLVRMGNLYKNRLDLDRRAVFYPNEYSETYHKFLLKSGDLIMSLTGTVDKEDYGYTVEIPDTKLGLLLNQRIAKIVFDEEALDKTYFLYLLRSRTFLDSLYSIARGVRQANLSVVNMRKLRIVLPPKEVQTEVSSVFKKLATEIDSLEAIAQQKLTDLTELKQSLLQKAFTGELTADWREQQA